MRRDCFWRGDGFSGVMSSWGEGGGDAREIANILIILTEVVFTQHLPLSVSVIIGLRIKTCWALP